MNLYQVYWKTPEGATEHADTVVTKEKAKETVKVFDSAYPMFKHWIEKV